MHARCGRHTGEGTRGSTLSTFFGDEGNTLSLDTYSVECKLLDLAEINICLRENFFLAFSKVLIILLSKSTLVSVEGGVTGISGLEGGYSAVDWSLWRETPSSAICFSTEGSSPGALEGLAVKSSYVGSSPFIALTFEALDDLKGSSKPFFLILVCGPTSFSASGSNLCSFLTGNSVFCSFIGRTGRTRGMCRSLRECLAVLSPLPRWDEGEVC